MSGLRVDVMNAVATRGSSTTWATWVAAVFVVGVSIWSLDSSLKLQEDSGIYIALAESLAAGQGYRDVFLVDRPLHVQYPPLFPALLAPVVGLRGLDIAAMKLVMTAAAVVALLLVAALFRRLAGDRTATLVVLATGASPALVYYTQSVMTEIPYLLVSLLAVLWIERCARTGWTVGGGAIAVGLLAAVYLLRIVGVALLAATVLYVLLDGEGPRGSRARTAVVLGVCAAIPLSLWLLYSSLASGGAGIPYFRYYAWSLEPVVSAPSGMSGWSVLVGKVRSALYAYGAHTGQVFFYWLPVSPAGDVCALFLTAIGVAGFAHSVVRRRTVIEYYVLFYVCALLVFPGSRQQRYMVPLIPFLWFYFLTGLERLLRRVPVGGDRERVVAVVGTAIVAVLILINAGTSVLANAIREGRGYHEPTSPDRVLDTLGWVRKETPAQSVFMWAKPSLGYVLGGRRAVKVPSGGPERIIRALREGNVDYVVVHPTWKGAGGLARLVDRHPNYFNLVHQDGRVGVYRVVKPAP
jgi:hypothetical protein